MGSSRWHMTARVGYIHGWWWFWCSAWVCLRSADVPCRTSQSERFSSEALSLPDEPLEHHTLHSIFLKINYCARGKNENQCESQLFRGHAQPIGCCLTSWLITENQRKKSSLDVQLIHKIGTAHTIKWYLSAWLGQKTLWFPFDHFSKCSE